jgi:hypothetical protein
MESSGLVQFCDRRADDGLMSRIDLRAPAAVALVAAFLLLFTNGGVVAAALQVALLLSALLVGAVLVARLMRSRM